MRIVDHWKKEGAATEPKDASARKRNELMQHSLARNVVSLVTTSIMSSLGNGNPRKTTRFGRPTSRKNPDGNGENSTRRVLYRLLHVSCLASIAISMNLGRVVSFAMSGANWKRRDG